MNLESFLLMRQELVLLMVIILLVIGEIFSNNKKGLVTFAIIIFAIHTIIGFLSLEEGTLFGGMFRTTTLIHMFKNVLNVQNFMKEKDYTSYSKLIGKKFQKRK